MKVEEKIKELKDFLNVEARNKYFLDYDGGDETRLFGETVHFDTECLLTESEYNQIIKLIEETGRETEDYQIYFGYDVSGYDYWYRIMEEGTYINLTINIKNVDNINVESLLSEIYQTIEELSEKIKAVKTIDEMFTFNYKEEMGL